MPLHWCMTQEKVKNNYQFGNRNFEGRSQVFLKMALVLKMAIDYVPTLVSQALKGIFGSLTHIGTGIDLDRLLSSKTQILK